MSAEEGAETIMGEAAAKAFVASQKQKEASQKKWTSTFSRYGEAQDSRLVETLEGGLEVEATGNIDDNGSGSITYGLIEHDSAVGWIQFYAQRGEYPVTPRVYISHLAMRYRGKGLGRAMYKAAINDLLKTYQCVQSDTSRSAAAEGVWGSFCRANPKKVAGVDKYGSGSPVFYRASGPGPLRRRPVKVRGHRRARQ
jgi:hypothetical protein